MDARLATYEEKMTKTMHNLDEEFGSIRAGRANPHVLDKLRVDYYGTPSPIQSVANVSVPEPRMIQIQPWEPSLVKAIEKAIELGAEHIVIFYDYNGLGHWATTTEKRWKAEKPIAKAYVNRFDELNKKINVNFYHVKAHTDIEGNELVDRMAKKEVGLL